MRNTIGDLVNELLPYSNVIEVTEVHAIPFVRAVISAKNSIAKCYMYIIQTNENAYDVCDHYDDTFGNRYFPNGSIDHPFVSEKELIEAWFTEKSGDTSMYTNVMRNISYTRFLEYLYDTLVTYKCTKFDPRYFKTKLSSLGFNNERLRKAIDYEFMDKRRRNGTIHDLFDIVNRQHKTFDLSNVRQKDIQCIIAKLKDIGINARINDDGIHHIELALK